MSNKFLNVKFGADTTGFKKGTNEVRAELTELNSAMRNNKREQKELNDEIKKLEKQQKALKTAMSQVKNPTKEMTDEAERLQKALDQAALKAAKLKTEEQELKGKISATTKELNEQNTAADKNAISMEKVGNAAKKAATLTATGMVALFTYTSKMAASAGDIDDMSKKIGVSVEEVQKLMYAAELSGTSYETLTGVYSKLIKNMDAATKGTGDAYEGFNQLGIPVTDASGKLRDHNEVLSEVLDALGKVENETERDAVALSILGKSALELNPLIEGGKDMLEEFSDELERQGVLLDQSQIDKLADFDDKLVKFKSTFQAKMMESSVDWVDAFDDLLDKSDEIVELVATLITGFAKVTGFVVEHKEAVLAVVLAYGGLKTAMNVKSLISSVITTFQSLKKATDAATISQSSLNSVIKAAPYMLLITLAASLIKSYTSIYEEAKKIKEEHSSILSRMKQDYEDAISVAKEEIDKLSEKGDRYEELRVKIKRTADEERELYNLASELEGMYPNQVKLIEAKTGAYMALGEQLDEVKDKLLKTAKATAISNALTEAYEYDMELDRLAKEASEDNVAAADKADKYSITIGRRQFHFGLSAIEQKKEFANASEIWAAIRENGKWISQLEAELIDYSEYLETASDLSGKLSDESINLAEALSVLREKYNLLSLAEKELQDNQELSIDMLNSIVAKYPDLQGVVNDYLTGLASGEDVINRLQLAYDMDVKNYQASIESKLLTTKSFYKSLREINDSYLNTLADKYSIDLSNYKTYADAKLAIENAFLTAKAKNWAKYYDIEKSTYKITNRDLMQYKKELVASGMSDKEADVYIEEYRNEYWDTVNAVNAWNSIDEKLDTSVYDTVGQYNPVFSNSSSGTTSSSGGSTSKKEISIYEQAYASFQKLVEDRIAEIEALTNAEVSGADERIAAIEAEIEAREKLAETEDIQKRIDFIKAQLNYSMLDEFERSELEKQLEDIEKEQSDKLWEESKRAEIDAIEAEKAAIESSNQALIDELNERMNYANTLFTDLNNGYKAATTIANNNSKTANITIVEKALTTGQVTQIVKDALGIGEVF